ncbi:hypothetical protein TNCV_603301 [Trichonephila clavipes]|nr:hypothetical protein TNCV_603301 [Trichonephila clavipes]
MEANVAKISSDTLEKVWDELAYRLANFIRFSSLVKRRYLDTIALRKGLNPHEIANLLRKISENEADSGELYGSNLADFYEYIGLSESDCEESEDSRF